MIAPKRVIDLELEEVSCVDSPANEGAQVLMFKSAAHMDPLGALEWCAKNYITKGETASVATWAREGTPAPRSVFLAALNRLASEIAPGLPPAMQMNLALAHPDGRALLAAIQRSP